MRLEIAKLREVIYALIDYTEAQYGEFLDLEDQMFCDIVGKTIFERELDQSVVTLGVLADEWESLQMVLDEEYGPVMYDFAWLSHILRAIAIQDLKSRREVRDKDSP
jgi:hypothetical protein